MIPVDLPSIPFTDDDLSDFLAYLRHLGYLVGTEQFVSVQLLLARLAQADQLPANPHHLARYIGPVVCATPRQQEEFRREFDIWIGLLMQSNAQKKSPPKTIDPLDESTLVSELRALRKRSQMIRFIIIGGLLFILVAIGLLSQLRLNVGKPVAPAESPPSGPLLSGAAMIVAALVMLAAILLFLLLRRRFLKRRTRAEPPDLDRYSVSNLPKGEWVPRVRRDVAVRMRYREYFETEELDVEKTVEACASAAGVFSPVYLKRTRIPEYLILIDRRDLEDHSYARATAIVKQLVEEGIFAVVYYFDADPRLVTAEGSGRRFLLSDLQDMYPLHRLIICSEGDNFVSPVTGRPYSWMSLFERWDNRSMLTLAPVVDWGAQENAIQSAGFKVLPSSPDGFGAATDARLAQQVVNDAKSFHPPRYPDSLAEDEEVWTSSNQPPAITVREVLEEVRDYLGETGYQWLAACAIYPEIKVVLTLYLGEQVASPYQHSILERLARLPWLRYAYMPDWLRRALLGALGGKRDRTVRSALQAFLLSPRDSLNSFVLDMPRDSLSSLARLWRRRSREWKSAAREGEPLKDAIFLTWMDDRLAFRIPRALFQWLRAMRKKRHQIASYNLSPDTAHYFRAQHAFPLRRLHAVLMWMAGAAALGWIYGWVSWWLSGWVFEIINFLALGVVSLCLAILCMFEAEGGHIRGKYFGIGIGFLSGLAFIYASWLPWYGSGKGLCSPADLRRLIIESAGHSAWPVLLYYLPWGMESFTIILAAILGAVDQATSPFCSHCRTWTTKRERVYGPLKDDALATRDILYGRYTRFFALSTTPPDVSQATVAVIENCDPTCLSTTLVTLKRRDSTRAARGELHSRQDKTLVERLYVPEYIVRTVYDWIGATESVRPNLVPPNQPRLRRIVAELLGLNSKGEFYVYGDIPVDKAAEARQRAKIPNHVPIAALAVSKSWLLVTFYSAYALTEEGVYAYSNIPVFTRYDQFDDAVLADTEKAKTFLNARQISFDEETAVQAIKRIKQVRQKFA